MVEPGVPENGKGGTKEISKGVDTISKIYNDGFAYRINYLSTAH